MKTCFFWWWQWFELAFPQWMGINECHWWGSDEDINDWSTCVGQLHVRVLESRTHSLGNRKSLSATVS